MIDMPYGMWTRGVVVAQRTVLQMGFILAPPGEYDGAICEVAPMRAIATITTADSPTSRSHILGVKVSCYLLVIVLPTNCVSPPGKHLIPLSLSTCLNSFLTIFHPDPCVLPIQIFLPDQPVLPATFLLRPFLCLHLLLRTLYLHTFVLSIPYPPLDAT